MTGLFVSPLPGLGDVELGGQPDIVAIPHDYIPMGWTGSPFGRRSAVGEPLVRRGPWQIFAAARG